MIFIMRGTSCSGKDTFIEKYFDKNNVLSSDMIRALILGDVADQTKNGHVFDFLRVALEYRLRFGVPYTVINATNLKYKDCHAYIELANKFKCPITFISIDPPELAELLLRSVQRGLSGGLVVPKEVLERHINSYYNSMSRFMQMRNELDDMTFVRIDQDYEVVNEV